jgi:chaperone required for assembly of F1-ATPase
MRAPLRRFYSQVSSAADGDGFAVHLDGRPLRSPAGRVMRLPTAPLADVVAEEWRAQENVIRPETMPIYAVAATAVDRVGPQRAAMIEQLLAYIATDLVCYRACEPADLVDEQTARWQPLLDWLAETWGVRLAVTDALAPVDQPADATDRLRPSLERMDDLHLAALAVAVPAAGSLAVGLALVLGRLDAEDALAAACVDELYQASRWGDDVETRRRREILKADLRAVEAVVDLSRVDSSSASARQARAAP